MSAEITNLSCPACGRALRLQTLPYAKVILWCAYGPCPSVLSNDGAAAINIEEAYLILHKEVTEELRLQKEGEQCQRKS
jgi:ssDNA-binding Zn-finger/Zn-ribbon topoisomerase 1